MAKKDGTGPEGMGARTGLGKGNCKAPASGQRLVKDLSDLELKGIFFDNNTKVQGLQQINKAILDELRARGLEAQNGVKETEDK